MAARMEMHLPSHGSRAAFHTGPDAGQKTDDRELFFFQKLHLSFLQVRFLERSKNPVEFPIQTVRLKGILTAEQGVVHICFSGTYSIYSVSL